MDDPLSDIFSLISLTGCVYFQRDFHAPWGMRIEGTGFAQFHVVTRGACEVEVDGQWHACSVGDVLLFPHGRAHTLADRRGRNAIDGPEVMASFAGDTPYFSDGPTSTRIVCGHYGYRGDITHPLTTGLPEFLHLCGLDLGPADTLSALPLLMAELASPSAGTRALTERYAEILLIQVLRIHARTTPATGFLGAVNDQRVSRVLARIHRDFASDIGLEELAREAALSRSAFSQRFRDLAGLAPIAYLTKWRMLAASGLLKTSGLSVAGVSAEVGYASDIAFTRAFKREFGVTPSSFRRHGLSSDDCSSQS